jgi:MIF4G domain
VKDRDGNPIVVVKKTFDNAETTVTPSPPVPSIETPKAAVKATVAETPSVRKAAEETPKPTPAAVVKEVAVQVAEKPASVPSVAAVVSSSTDVETVDVTSRVIADVAATSSDTVTAAEAEAAAAAKAAEKKKVELEKAAENERLLLAKKKAEEEAVLLKQLQDEDRQRIESEKKRVAVELEEEERKKKVAETEEKRIAAEVKKVADDLAQAKIDDDETKRKAEVEAEKKRRLAEEEKKISQKELDAAAAAAAIADPRSKKAKQKDALAAKDAANSADSMLDAYTEPVVGVVVPSPPPVVAEPAPKVESEIEQEPEDDWEASADKPFEAPTPLPAVPAASARRSLRPGGGVDQQRLNAGFASASNKPKQVYSKTELISFRPPTVVEADRPSSLVIYKALSKPRVPGGQTGQGDAGNSQKGGGQGGSAWGRGEMKGGQGPQDGNRPRLSGEGLQQDQHEQGADGWARSGPLPPLPPQAARPAKASKGVSGPRPVKVIADPIERLSSDVLSILNKITPQTFEKLTGKMCDIPVGTSSELDKMIQLVFEKANLDTSFAHLYAEMCAALELSSRRWAFLQYVYNKDTNQYFWIKDLTFDNVLAGPFISLPECINATLGAEPPVMQHVEIKVEVMELTVTQNILIMVSYYTMFL